MTRDMTRRFWVYQLRFIRMADMSKLGQDGKPIYDVSGKAMKRPHYFKPNLNKFVI